MVKSIKHVRDDFYKSWRSISELTRINNFSSDLIYRILRNNKIHQPGESHKVVIKLGIMEQKYMN